GLDFVSAMASQGGYDNTSGVWTVGTVASGTPQRLQIQARVVSAAAQTNTAAIDHADQFDPNPGNNTGSTTETPQQADLSVSKRVSNPTPNVGDVITFTITLANAGPDSATNVTVRDPLPAGLDFVSAAPSLGNYDSTTGLWTVGTLPGTASVTLTLQARARGPATPTHPHA